MSFEHSIHPQLSCEDSILLPANAKVDALGNAVIPEGTVEIGENAFRNRQDLRKVILPSSIQMVHRRAFSCCTGLTHFHILCDKHALQPAILDQCPSVRIQYHGHAPDFDLELYLKGVDLLTKVLDLAAPNHDFWSNAQFAACAHLCAQGDAQAMLELADLLQGYGTQPFYAYASNFWRYRAYQYGNAQAKVWKERRVHQHPGTRIPSVIPSTLEGNHSGKLLRAIGFSFFHPNRMYRLSGVDQAGIVEISSWCGEDGADEDGFGSEDYYDWWYLNEFLQEIPSVSMIHNFSRHERRAFPDTFGQMYSLAKHATHGCIGAYIPSKPTPV